MLRDFKGIKGFSGILRVLRYWFFLEIFRFLGFGDGGYAAQHFLHKTVAV